MGRKKIIISLTENFKYSDNEYSVECGPFGAPLLGEKEYPHLYLDHKITTKELNRALNVITTSLMQNKSHLMIVDLDEREKLFTPVKEMTIEDVEKELGYRVKIIGGKNG